MALAQLKKDLRGKGNKERAVFSIRFFRTAKGEYAYGDKFLGVTVPDQRLIAKKYKDISLEEIRLLLTSEIHEERLVALLILVNQFEHHKELQKEICDFYLKNTKFINNWDLVDLSAPKILGSYLLNNDKKLLYKLARSNNLWEKRIAIVATYAFIKDGDLAPTLEISKILLQEKHHLIHKAVGWMLREVGKKNEKVLEKFLEKHIKSMPRTTLRYAIERFSQEKRKMYLKM